MNAVAEYQQERQAAYTKATDEVEPQFIEDLSKMSFLEKSFLDEGFLDERDGLPLGSRIAICPKLNPAKKNSPFPVDLSVEFFQQTGNEWKHIKSFLGDLKERFEPRYLIERAYRDERIMNPNIIEYPFHVTVGLDEGNEKCGREYANYWKAWKRTGEDIWLFYAINYKQGKGKFGKVLPETNQSLYMTSVRRVAEAEAAKMIVKTKLTRKSGKIEFVNQLPFPLILPNGKPLFQKVIANYVIGR